MHHHIKENTDVWLDNLVLSIVLCIVLCSHSSFALSTTISRETQRPLIHYEQGERKRRGEGEGKKGEGGKEKKGGGVKALSDWLKGGGG